MCHKSTNKTEVKGNRLMCLVKEVKDCIESRITHDYSILLLSRLVGRERREGKVECNRAKSVESVKIVMCT